jgi:hypothetical protein
MVNINKFIDKVAACDYRKNNTVILTIEEAKSLRDEISKLLSYNYDLLNNKQDAIDDTVIQVELNGGKW